MVNEARVSLAASPRLLKIVPRSTIQTSRLRGELVARVNVALPDDSDTSVSAREEWVWSPPMLTRSLNSKAFGFLAMAHASTPAAWNDATAALGADGRFQVDYMAEQRRLLRQRRAAVAAGPGPGSFDAKVTPGMAWIHVVPDTPIVADAELTERLATLANDATTGFDSTTMQGAGFEVRKIAVGTALLSAMRARNHALAVVPKMPAVGEAVATQTLLGYLYEQPTVAPTAPPTGAAAAARTEDAGATVMALLPGVLAALRPAQAKRALSSTGSEKIVLGKAPTTDGALKRPEYFAAGDVSDFRRHGTSLLALEATDRPTGPSPTPSSCGAAERCRTRRARSSMSRCTRRTSRKTTATTFSRHYASLR